MDRIAKPGKEKSHEKKVQLNSNITIQDVSSVFEPISMNEVAELLISTGDSYFHPKSLSPEGRHAFY